MVTIGEFSKLVSEAIGDPAPTVAQVLRVLRDDGLLSTGGRGSSAPTMTPLDGARVLIALLVSEKPAKAAESVRDFGPLPAQDRKLLGHDDGVNLNGLGLPFHHSFEDALAWLLEAFAKRHYDEFYRSTHPLSRVSVVDIEVRPDIFPIATIHFHHTFYRFFSPAPGGAIDPKLIRPKRISHGVGLHVLDKLSRCFIPADATLLNAPTSN